MFRLSFPAMTTPYPLPTLLDGQVALVTGGGRGNGCAIALGLAEAGATVVVADVDATTAESTAAQIRREGGRSVALAWDISEPAHAERAREQLQALGHVVSVLVNNAGIEVPGSAGGADYATGWKRLLNVNLDGTMRVTEALLPQLRQRRGSIVNNVSVQSMVALQAHASAYAVSKAAIAQYTRSLAVELAPDAVRVNSIAPGFFATSMTASTRADPVRHRASLQRVPLARYGEPEELVGPVVFLASAMASYVTGALIAVDGGLLAL